MSTFYTSGFVAAVLAAWFTMAAWGQVGSGLPSNPLPPPRPPKTEPARPDVPPRADDPVVDKVLRGEEINRQLKEAREGDPNTTKEAIEDSKARIIAQQKADEAKARAERIKAGTETARDRAIDAKVRATVENQSAPTSPPERAVFRPAGVRPADIGIWFDRADRSHLVVTDVATSGAISKLGLREGDRILTVAGHRVTAPLDFMEYLFAEDLRDQQVELVVARSGREYQVNVTPNALIDDYHHVDVDPFENFGVVLDDRYDDRYVVWRVLPQSPAYYAGLRAGDTFVTFGGDKIVSRSAFVNTLSGLPAGEVAVQVRRGDRLRDFRVDVPAYVARTPRRVYDLRTDTGARATVVEPVETPALPGVTPLSPPTEAIPKRIPRP